MHDHLMIVSLFSKTWSTTRVIVVFNLELKILFDFILRFEFCYFISNKQKTTTTTTKWCFFLHISICLNFYSVKLSCCFLSLFWFLFVCMTTTFVNRPVLMLFLPTLAVTTKKNYNNNNPT